MADFDGKPLCLRDDVERAFWGRVFAAEWSMSPYPLHDSNYVPKGDIADLSVVEMRLRQRTVSRDVQLGSSLCAVPACAVCLRHEQPHADGCPGAELKLREPRG